MFITIAFAPGDKVLIKDADFEAVVNKITVERGCVVYQCQWWVDKQMHGADFYETELEAVSTGHGIELAMLSGNYAAAVRIDENHPLYKKLPREKE